MYAPASFKDERSIVVQQNVSDTVDIFCDLQSLHRAQDCFGGRFYV